MSSDLHLLTARAAARAIRDGQLTAEALTRACLDRIAETDATLKAWQHVDADGALAQAAELDRIRRAGHATGPLHGVPVGLKDIVDVAGLPCERGTQAFAGRVPEADAALVERLREAGAVILGKTKTTELAFVHPTDTVNPHDHARTPGGSSSGSAAAVAANQVPLAVGTQTNGSVIRPASFCGTYGFKPTRGVISRRGVLQTSVSLDQVGVFARTLEDAALLTDALGAYDQSDPASFPRPRPGFLAGCEAEPPVEPDIVWFELPFLDRLEPDAREGFEAILEELGPRVERWPTAPELTGLVEVQATIHEYEFCDHLSDVIEGNWEVLSPTLKPVIERGRAISRAQYEDALEVKASAEAFFGQLFNDFDAILCPSARGEAPLRGEGGTGDPIFCTIWTLAGLPSLSLPILVGANDLPVGVQLIGAAEEDDRLLRTANWLQRSLTEED